MARPKRSSTQKPTELATPTAPAVVNHPTRGPVLVLVSVALLLRAIVLVQLHSHPLLQPTAGLDDGVYLQLAHRVMAGDWALGPDVYFLSPFYTYFLAVALFLTGDSVLGVRLLQIVLGAAAVGLIYGTARRWFGDRAALVAGAFAALTGVFAFYEILLLQSAVDPFLAALALYAFTRALQAPGWRWPAGAGVALGLEALNRPNVLPFVAVAVCGLWAVQRSRAGAIRAAAFVLAAAVTLAPAAVRNRVVAGEWIAVSSHGGLNFYIGNNANADGTYTLIEGVTPSIEGQLRDTRAIAERAEGRRLSASEVSGYFYGEAFAWMAAHPGDAAALMLRKAWYVLNGADLALNYSFTFFSRDESTLLGLLIVGPWMLVPLGLVGLVIARPGSRLPEYAVWVSFVPVYALLVAAFFVSTRYRLPLLVPLCAGAGAAVTWAWERARAKEFRRLVVPAGVLALLIVVANWSVGPDIGRAEQATEMALHLISRGDTARAEEMLARLESRHPQKGVLAFRVGQTYAARGDLGHAAEWLQRAESADPNEPNIQLVLGQVLVGNGRNADAIPHLRKAIAAGVGADEAGIALTGALDALGRRDEAREALQAAVRAADRGGSGPDWLTLGLTAMRLQDPVEGERLFRRAVSATPSRADAYENLGLALIVQGRAADAIPVIGRAADLAPSSPTVRYNLAVALAQEGRLAEARAQAETALRLRPDYQQAIEMMGRLNAVR